MRDYVKLEHYIIFKRGLIVNSRTGKIVKGYKHKSRDGVYMRVRLYLKTGPIRIFVHRLVAESFLGPSNGLEVNHLDGDTLNNRADNLEWATPQDNKLHAVLLKYLKAG